MESVEGGSNAPGRAGKRLFNTRALSVYPYVDYKGEGYWNLRAGTNPSDFRIQSPNFIQKSNKGYGYEASLGLIYELTENRGTAGRVSVYVSLRGQRD